MCRYETYLTGAESFELLERTKPADVTDEDVTDKAKAQIYRGSYGEGKVHIDIVQQEQARRSDRGRD